MAKQLVITLLCDGLHEEEERKAKHTIQLRVNGVEGELDFCESCVLRFRFDELGHLLRTVGQPVTDRVPCRRCDQTFKSEESLGAHRRRAHRLAKDWETPL